MNDDNLKTVYNYLRQRRNEYLLASSRESKQSIEDSVRNYAKNLDDEVYLTLNDDLGDGLFRHGFFESDLDKSISKLKELLNE